MTHHAAGLVIEAGPDSFLSQKPWALGLCRQLGLTDQLMNTNPLKEKAFVYSRGRLRPLPDGLVMFVPTKLGPTLRSGLLSVPGTLRMAMDLIIPRKQDMNGDESLASFFRRRLGHEAFERLIEPLMAGIYAGDAEQISLQATFPRFLEMERRSGSLIRGMLAARATAPRDAGTEAGWSAFITLREGLYTIINALLSRLENAGVQLRVAQRVTTIRRRSIDGGEPAFSLLFDTSPLVSADAVVLTIPAYVTADLIRGACPVAAGLLGAIHYASTATVSLAYHKTDVESRVRGFGFVVPRAEGRPLLAATWTSLKWPYRAPPSQTLIRGYVGGVGREDIVAADDETITQCVRRELADIAGITAAPFYVEVNRWPHGMPQYALGHCERMAKIEEALRPLRGLYVAGAAYRGIGIPDCIRDGAETADRVLHDLMENAESVMPPGLAQTDRQKL